MQKKLVLIFPTSQRLVELFGLEALLKKREYAVVTNDNTPEPEYYNFYNKKSPLYSPFYYPHVTIFQIPWYRDASEIDEWEMQRDPNIQLRKFIGRGMDLNIAIYDPKAQYLDGEYYIVIRNPDSINKVKR